LKVQRATAMLKDSLSRKPWIAWSLLAGWAILLIVVIASLSVKHLASLPRPNNYALLNRVLKYRRSSSLDFLVHVIYSECTCSSRLLTHLVARRPFAGTEELILFVGVDPSKEKLARNSGFEFVTVTASELLSDFGLEAAPVLVMFDSAGKLRYAAGYYDNPATVISLDEKIHVQFLAHARIEPLPIFGCAVSPQLQRSLDPLRLSPTTKP
jgi:hypothetical protein